MQMNSSYEIIFKKNVILTSVLKSVKKQNTSQKIQDSKIYNRFELDLENIEDLNKEVRFTFTVIDRKNPLVHQQITGKFRLGKLLAHHKTCLCLKSALGEKYKLLIKT
jgi:hypothetical protein